MAITADYLNKLVTQKNTLADNLVTKGVTATHDETLETLIPKVLDISGGGSEGIHPIGQDGRPTGDVTVPEGVTSLYQYIFYGNTNVTSVLLPDSLVEFDDYAFQNCTGLSEINIPDNVSIIPQCCFNGCTAIANVILPKKLTEIYKCAFQNCSNLSTITIPDDITNLIVRDEAFKGCSNLTNETVSRLAQLVQGTIYAYAFGGLTGITEVTTAYTNNYYFYNCTNLKKVTILNPLDNGGFGSNVFYDCPNLMEVILPEGAQTINTRMFSGNSNLSTVNFPESITQIGSYAFESCTGLTNLSIPDNASYSLGSNAFYNTGITDSCATEIISHATSIGDEVFRNCMSLINVAVPIFAYGMFSFCINLKTAISIIASDSTGNRVFRGCSNLESVSIADGTVNIGSSVFEGCTSLKTVYLPSSITTDTNGSLSATSSSYYAFYGCTALEDVQLGNDWNISLRLNVSENLTVKSMTAMFEALKDLTDDTAKTLTLGSTNLAKLTDEQIAIATNKNWTLA